MDALDPVHLAREAALLREKSDLLQRQATMAQEFEHRLLNSLQMIVSLLRLQSRAASTAEAATQCRIQATIVPAHHTVPGLVDAIVEYFQRQPATP